MADAETGLLSRLRAVSEPTATEKKLIKYFESSYPLVAFETIRSMSEKSEVGTSSITRFCIRLGYSSFADFMECLRKEVTSQLETPIQKYAHINEEMKRDEETLLDTHILTCTGNFNTMRSRLNQEDFSKAVEILSNIDGRLFITGSASSYGLAYYFNMLSTYLRPNVYLLDPGAASLSHNMIDVNSRDSLLAILHYRFSTQTVEVCRWFDSRNAKTVIISDREHNPVSSIASVQLTSSSESSVMFNSRVATLLLLETLIAAVANRREREVYQRFNTFEDLRNIFGTFTEPFIAGTDPATESEQ